MSIRLTCPYCQFSGHISADAIPPHARRAVCPRCGNRFDLLQTDPEQASQAGAVPPALLDRKTGEESPGAGPGEAQGVAWERKEETGIWRALWGTLKEVLGSPTAFFRRPAADSGLTPPLSFGLLVGSAARIIGLFGQMLLLGGGLALLDVSGFPPVLMGAVFVGLTLLIPLVVGLGLMIYSGILHVLLRIVGVGAHRFEDTFRVVAYSQAAQIWTVLPLFGDWVAGIHQLVVQIIGLHCTYDASYGRICFAYLIPILFGIFFALGVLLIVALAPGLVS